MIKPNNTHPVFGDLKSDLKKGKLSRREFLRFAALLGLSTTVASQGAQMVFPKRAHAVSYGGKLRVSGLIQKIYHPAELTWIAPSQPFRLVAEYLTYTDENNITHPFLLDRWHVSDDLATWTLHLKKGITFTNGDEFTADDVVFSFNQWLDPRLNSSTNRLFGSYLDSTGIEKIDTYGVRLHLKRPEIALPEHLFHFPAMVLNHKTFEGDFLTAPHGTGPFTLEAFEENHRCLFKKRRDYRQPGLPFLDQVEFKDLGHTVRRRVSALMSDTVDLIDLSDIQPLGAFDALKNEANIHIASVPTSQTNVLRMRVDRNPWSDNTVRKAMKLCQHREKLLYLANAGQGIVGHDCHVCPTHPEYCAKPRIKYDPLRAKSLLEASGYPDGMDVSLTIGDKWPDIERYAQILKRDAERGGFRIHIEQIPNAQYMEKYTTFDFGITPWTHYPLGLMPLNLAYSADEYGHPGPLNETRWVDEEFSQLLNQANGTLDVAERKKLFCKLEDIQMQRGSVGISWWQNTWIISRKNVQGIIPHPANYLILDRAWLSS
jgi:peptide/nickel transport system substrate-binding protein